MRYVKAKYAKEQEDLAYRFYMADSLFYQADQKRLTVRLADIIHPKPIDRRSGDEIANDVIGRIGLKME